MLAQTAKKRELFASALNSLNLRVFALVLALLLSLILTRLPAYTNAATNNTLNFQARLQTSSGNIVPDGTYNVEFKLYDASTSSGSSQGSCTGDANCLWTEDYTSGAKITVSHGYLTANLGSQTPFPGTINWDQELYLTMRIGGTGSPSWDTEMNPRLRLTGVPYAFQAKSAAQLQANQGTYSGTLNFATLTGGDQVFILPDQGTAGTYTLLTGAAANGSYIQNQNASPQTADFNISGDGTADVFNALTGFSYNGTAGATTTCSGGDFLQNPVIQGGIITGGSCAAGGGGGGGFSGLTLAGDSGTDQTISDGDTITIAGGTNITTVGGATDTVTINVVNNPTFSGQITSTVASGTAPLVVTSNTMVANLNANYVGGYLASALYDTLATATAHGSTTSVASTFSGGLSASGGFTANGGAVSISNNNGTDTTDIGTGITTGAINIGGGSNTLAVNTTNWDVSSAGAITGLTGLTMASGNFLQSGTGTFSTGSGAVSLNGATSVTGSNTFTVGTGLSSLGGALTVAGATTLNGDLTVGNASSDRLTLTAQLLGASPLVFQGGTDDSYTTSFAITDPTSSNKTITFPNLTGTVCLSVGNCVGGGGGGAIGGAGTLNTIALFTPDGNNVGDSILTQSGTTVTNTGTFQATTALQAPVLDVAAAGTLSLGTSTATTINIGRTSGTIPTVSIQGNAVSLVSSNGTNSTTIGYGGVQAAGNITYNFDRTAAAGTYTVCTTVGNCTGAGGSIMGSGTSGQVAYFNAGNSIKSEAGFTYNEGTDTFTAVNVQGSTAVRAPLLDTASAVALNIGTTNATQINLNKSVVVAAQRTIQFVGGTTAQRPVSPTEGMVYYDTTTKQLLTYANGKWQADRNTSTKIVAASNSSQALKDSADYVATGSGDQSTINSALTAAAGGKVYLTEGTYLISASISIPNNTTLTGAGAGTLITIPNGQNGTYNMITNTDTSTGMGVTISNLTVDGNKANQTSGTMAGVYINGVGSSTRNGVLLSGLNVNNVRGDGIVMGGQNGTLTGSNISGNGSNNVHISAGYNTVSGNVMRGGIYGIQSEADHNIMTGNEIEGAANAEISLSYNSLNSVTGNEISNTPTGIQLVASDDNIISGNNISNTSNFGIQLYNYFSLFSDRNLLSGNRISDSGGSTANNGIYLYTDGTDNRVVGNDITDSSCTTTCNAIIIVNSINTYLSNNTFTGDGTYTAIIDDSTAGTGTVYANQARGENGAQLTVRTANATDAFSIQNASGNAVLTADTTNNKVLLGKASSVTGQLQFNSASGTGSINLTPANPGSSTYTLTLPAETGTICTTAASASCLSAYSGSGVTTVGTLDGGTYSGNGASISGTTIYLQAATASHVGLVTTANQSFGGIKSFSRVGIGATSTNTYDLEVNGTTLLGQTDTTGALSVKDANSDSIFGVDTQNKFVGVDGRSSTGTAFRVVQSGSPSAGNALIVANAATGVTGNLIDLQLNAVSKFNVNQAGNVSIAGVLDTTTAAALNVGTTNATQINLNKTTQVTGDLNFANGADRIIKINNAASGAGNNLTIQGATGTSNNNGGNVTVQAGSSGGGTTGNGGGLTFLGGTANSTNGNGGNVTFNTGLKGTGGTAGSIIFAPQNSSNNSTNFVQIRNGSGTAILNVDSTNNIVQVASALDTTTATALNLGTTNATAINLNQNTAVTGTVDATSGYKYNGTSGSSTTCSGGNVLQNAVVQGGIITGGTCVANGGGVAPTLQDAYNNSSSPATIALTSGKGVIIKDYSSTVGNIFQIQNNAGSSTYFAVTSGGIQAASLDTVSAGTLSIGTTNATTINVGTNNANHTINIGTGTGNQNINVGVGSGSGTTTIQGGTGGMSFNIAPNAGGYNFNVGGTGVLGIDQIGRVLIQPNANYDDTLRINDISNSAVFKVSTLTGLTYAEALEVGWQGLQVDAGLTFSGSATTNFTTPLGSTVPTKINIPLYDPGANGQQLIFGLPNGAASNSRAISIMDNRAAGDNQPVLAVFSPNENNIIGLNWDGSNSAGILKTNSTTTSSSAGVTVTSGQTNGGTGLTTGDVTIQTGTGNGTNTSSGNINLYTGNYSGSGTSGKIVAKAVGGNRTDFFNVQNASGNNILTVDSTNGEVELGKASTLGGKLVFYNATNGNTITLSGATATSNRAITLPDAAGTVCLTSGNCSTAGSGYILNQSGTPGTPQTGNFNITGTGIAATLQASTSVLTPLLDTASAVALNVGTTNATQINLNKNTQVTGNLTFVTGANRTISVQTQTTSNTAGNNLTIQSATGNGTGAGGTLNLLAGSGGATGIGGAIGINGGDAGSGNLVGGQVTIAGGSGSGSSAGGTVWIGGGTAGATGTGGGVGIYGGLGGSTSGAGGGLTLQGGNAVTSGSGGGVSIAGGTAVGTNQAGASITITTGNRTGSGTAGTVVIKPASSSDSASFFQVQDAAGAPLLTADTVARSAGGGNLIKIGNSTGTDTALTILKLDSATANPTSNLSALNGGLFYNSTSNKISVIENGTVKVLCNTTDLGCGSGGGVTLQGSTPGTADTGNFNITGVGITGTSLLTPLVDTASAVALNIGTTNATVINLNENTTVAAGKSLTITGGNTGSRPGSPTEGALYYDTTTKQILVYANSKWQGDRSTATKIVAASNSSQAAKDSADYVASGTGDQSTINSALTAASGGKVYLTEGTYTLSAAISIPNNTTLEGAGAGTIITVPNAQNGSYNMITNTDTSTGTGVTITNLTIDGNKANQSSGTMYGIYLNNMGGGTGTSAREGAKVSNNRVKNVRGGSSAGIRLTSSSNNTLTGNTIQGNASYGIYLGSSSNNTLTGNTTQGNNVGIFIFSSSNNTLTGNTTQGNTQHGISLSGSSNNTLTGNTAQGNTTNGIDVGSSSNNNTLTGNTTQGNGFDGFTINSSSNNTLTGNTTQGNTRYGILISSSNNNTIASNKIDDNNDSTSNNGIYLSGSDYNSITGNSITDSACTTTCYAINISSSTSDKNTLSGNTFSGSSANAASINDAGTNTIYSNQQTNSTTGTNSDVSDTRFRGSANSTTAFSVQNAGGTSVMNIDTTNGKVLVSGTIDTTSATTLNVGTATATAISIGTSSSTTTFNGNVSVASGKTMTIQGATTVGTTNSSAFLIQDGSSNALLTANTSAMTVVIGNSGNTVTLSANGISLAGTAQKSATIVLNPEYPSAVLDQGGTGANAGTMTSGWDSTGRVNYYNWTATSGTAQNYDIVVQVPIPNDFAGWSGATPISFSTYTSNTTNGTALAQVIKSNNTIDSNFTAPPALTMGSTNTWITNSFAMDSSNYTAGDYLTIRVRLSAQSSANVKAGKIILNYKTAY